MNFILNINIEVFKEMYTEESLQKLSRDKLKSILKDVLNIHKGYSNKKKPELIKLILDNQPYQPDDSYNDPNYMELVKDKLNEFPIQSPEIVVQPPEIVVQQHVEYEEKKAFSPEHEFKNIDEEIEYMKGVISQLYIRLEKLPVQARNIILYPYFEWREHIIPEVDDIIENHDKPRTSLSKQKISITDQNDIANILSRIEKEKDNNSYNQIPRIRKNIEKCIGIRH